MAVKGKRKYTFYLDEDNVEFLKTHFATTKDTGGLSLFIDKYIERSVWMLKSNPDIFKNMKSGKMTFGNLWQVVKLQWRVMDEYENCELKG